MRGGVENEGNEWRPLASGSYISGDKVREKGGFE